LKFAEQGSTNSKPKQETHMYATDTPANSIRSTFLTDLESELNHLRNRVQDIGARLQEAGFYGPAEEAAKAQPPSENNTRSRIHDELRYLDNHIGRVEHQIGQIA
jgi:hypothetical protein